MPPEQLAALDAANKAMARGEPHALLASMAGGWRLDITRWPEPGTPPATSTGTATHVSTMGGRFLESELHGTVLDRDFHSRSVVGFDNVTGHFIGAWWDDLTTTILAMTGEFDEAARTFTFRGEMADVSREGATARIRQTMRLDGPDRHVAEWFEVRDGKEALAMRIVYTRATAGSPPGR